MQRRQPTDEQRTAYGQLRRGYDEAREKLADFRVDDISMDEGSPYQTAWREYEQAAIALRRYMEGVHDVDWPDAAPE